MKNARIEVRLTIENKMKIREMAMKRGLTISDFVLLAVFNLIKEEEIKKIAK